MSDTVTIPRTVWENVLHDLSFIKKAIVPLAKGYKPTKWITAAEAMEMLEIGPSRLKQLRASGCIRYQKPATGNCTEYYRQDIIDYKQGHIVISSKKTA